MAKPAKKTPNAGVFCRQNAERPYLNPTLKVLIFWRFKGFIETILALHALSQSVHHPAIRKCANIMAIPIS